MYYGGYRCHGERERSPSSGAKFAVSYNWAQYYVGLKKAVWRSWVWCVYQCLFAEKEKEKRLVVLVVGLQAGESNHVDAAACVVG